jgi:hypothetical protein
MPFGIRLAIKGARKAADVAVRFGPLQRASPLGSAPAQVLQKPIIIAMRLQEDTLEPVAEGSDEARAREAQRAGRGRKQPLWRLLNVGWRKIAGDKTAQPAASAVPTTAPAVSAK